MCWYYKINERLAAQQETNWLLTKLLNEYPKIISPAASIVSPHIQNPKKIFCTNCGKQHLNIAIRKCEYCGADII